MIWREQEAQQMTQYWILNNMNNIRQLIDIVEDLQSTPKITVHPPSRGSGRSIKVDITDFNTHRGTKNLTATLLVDDDSYIRGTAHGDYVVVDSRTHHRKDIMSALSHAAFGSGRTPVSFSKRSFRLEVEKDENVLDEVVDAVHSHTDIDKDVLFDLIFIDYQRAEDDIQDVLDYLVFDYFGGHGDVYDDAYRHVKSPSDQLLDIE